MRNEYRFAVGGPEERRSTIWKIAAWRSDVYIFSRMFGQDAKVSLHATGHCQWSATSDWVKASPGRRNAQRHIVKWQLPAPEPAKAQWVFEIRIPSSELRQIDAAHEKVRGVHWVPAPPSGAAAVVLCFLVQARDSDPAIGASLPGQLLKSFQLADGRWFVIVLAYRTSNSEEISNLREGIIASAKTLAPSYEPRQEHRACAFAEWSPSARGLIEVCLQH